MDATLGWHTEGFGPSGFIRHLNKNAMGTCLIIFLKPTIEEPGVHGPFAADMMKAVTGWDRSREELLRQVIGLLTTGPYSSRGDQSSNALDPQEELADLPRRRVLLAGISSNIQAEQLP